jgi:hypothetical protein
VNAAFFVITDSGSASLAGSNHTEVETYRELDILPTAHPVKSAVTDQGKVGIPDNSLPKTSASFRNDSFEDDVTHTQEGVGQ